MPTISLSPEKRKVVEAWKTIDAKTIEAEDAKTIEAEDAKTIEEIYKKATRVKKHEAYIILEKKLNTYLSHTRSVENLTNEIESKRDEMSKLAKTIENLKLCYLYMNVNTIYILKQLEARKQSCISYIITHENSRLNTMKAQNQSHIAYMEAFKVWDELK